MVLKRTAAAKKQMVATIPATTGRASPRSSTNSGGGKKSEGEEREGDKSIMKSNSKFMTETEPYTPGMQTVRKHHISKGTYAKFCLLTEPLTWTSFILMLQSAFNLWLQNRD